MSSVSCSAHSSSVGRHLRLLIVTVIGKLRVSLHAPGAKGCRVARVGPALTAMASSTGMGPLSLKASKASASPKLSGSDRCRSASAFGYANASPLRTSRAAVKPDLGKLARGTDFIFDRMFQPSCLIRSLSFRCRSILPVKVGSFAFAVSVRLWESSYTPGYTRS